MEKVNIDEFLKEVEIKEQYGDYRIFEEKTTGHTGVVNVRTSELTQKAIYDKMFEPGTGGYFFLRMAGSTSASTIWHIFCGETGVTVLAGTSGWEGEIEFLPRGRYFRFSQNGLWGLQDARLGMTIASAGYDRITPESVNSNFYFLYVKDKRSAIFDENTGEIFLLQKH
jgi:hypothetical protein